MTTRSCRSPTRPCCLRKSSRTQSSSFIRAVRTACARPRKTGSTWICWPSLRGSLNGGDHGYTHRNTCGDQPDRHSFRSTGHVGDAHPPTLRSLDDRLSCDHRGHKRDRLLFSVPRLHTCDRCRNPLARCPRNCRCCSLRSSSCWRLALDLCSHRHGRPVFQLLRLSRPVLSEGSRLESSGADSVGASVCSRSTHRSRYLPCACDCSIHKIPSGAGSHSCDVFR